MQVRAPPKVVFLINALPFEAAVLRVMLTPPCLGHCKDGGVLGEELSCASVAQSIGKHCQDSELASEAFSLL